MTPTLAGRLQTRIFLLVTIGALWTLVITPLLPGDATLGEGYAATYGILALVLVAGIVWELVYHGLQQFRWEKDWPTLFGLLTGVNEGIAVWVLAATVGIEVTGPAFLLHFATTWLAVWLFANGPMRVLFIRWRFRGGRLA